MKQVVKSDNSNVDPRIEFISASRDITN